MDSVDQGQTPSPEATPIPADAPSSTPAATEPTAGPREGAVYSNALPDALVAPQRDAPSTEAETKEDVPAWQRALDELPEDKLEEVLKTHPKLRSAHQRLKDPEISRAEQRAAEAAQRRWEAEQRANYERQMAAAEQARLDSLPDEELGREIRQNSVVQKYLTQAQQEAEAKYHAATWYEIAPDLDPEVLSSLAQDLADQKFQTGGQLWKELLRREGEARSRKVAAEAVDAEVEKRLPARVEEEVRRRLAHLRLGEQAPDVDGVQAAPGVRVFYEDDIANMGVEEYQKVRDEVQQAIAQGRFLKRRRNGVRT